MNRENENKNKNSNFESFNLLKKEFKKLVEENNLLNEPIEAHPVNVQLDTTRISDYPLLNGKEFLLRAFFKGAVGDAFTGDLKEFKGTIAEVLESDYNPLVIATLNAVMRYLGLTEKTEHCIKNEPEICAKKLSEYIVSELGTNIKIGIIGYHPAIIKQMVDTFGKENVMATDLDFNNIGRIKHGIVIYHADMNEYLIKNSDIVLSTGSTAANGTIFEILDMAKKYNKRIIFYGTTVAGVSKILNLERFCECGK
ncbi:Rossmann-like domain-containing protein [Methanothermococcus okinawensis]|uniref:Putative heavy-metal chelation domain-containing protein n=1 Tax=Methanothermococcus okinawensis (strain DSM 14208 / JCM 11175 / IH1) TaxID=647113 RepID=F8AKI9_METOI|nr:DUF364 domain-containing protein [Methanothermococcus okinawensis]AEH07519.1 hypothetical protein Metok_1556 [Methanothermococcus okinawensis IH1]